MKLNSPLQLIKCTQSSSNLNQIEKKTMKSALHAVCQWRCVDVSKCQFINRIAIPIHLTHSFYDNFFVHRIHHTFVPLHCSKMNVNASTPSQGCRCQYVHPKMHKKKPRNGQKTRIRTYGIKLASA